MWDRLKDATRPSILDLMQDPARAEAFSVHADGLLFDYSKTTMDGPAREDLIALAQAQGLDARRDAMFSGAKINETEGRAVLHTALRNLSGGPVEVAAGAAPRVHLFGCDAKGLSIEIARNT